MGRLAYVGSLEFEISSKWPVFPKEAELYPSGLKIWHLDRRESSRGWIDLNVARIEKYGLAAIVQPRCFGVVEMSNFQFTWVYAEQRSQAWVHLVVNASFG